MYTQSKVMKLKITKAHHFMTKMILLLSLENLNAPRKDISDCQELLSKQKPISQRRTYFQNENENLKKMSFKAAHCNVCVGREKLVNIILTIIISLFSLPSSPVPPPS